jgi:hypothetical protein
MVKPRRFRPIRQEALWRRASLRALFEMWIQTRDKPPVRIMLNATCALLAMAPQGPVKTGKYGNEYSSWPGLSFDSVSKELALFGIHLDDAQIERAVAKALANFKQYKGLTRARLGKILQLTETDRRKAGARNITSIDKPLWDAEKIKAQKREDDAAKAARYRLKNGCLPREMSTEQSKPWEAKGISRMTWYRRQAERKIANEPVTEPNRGIRHGRNETTLSKRHEAHKGQTAQPAARGAIPGQVWCISKDTDRASCSAELGVAGILEPKRILSQGRAPIRRG